MATGNTVVLKPDPPKTRSRSPGSRRPAPRASALASSAG
ncbi:hypothetical protein ABZ260_25755 [Streptosporangium sp. NPDC006013]